MNVGSTKKVGNATPTFAVDGHMTLPDGGVKVSTMTCGGEGMEGTCDIN